MVMENNAIPSYLVAAENHTFLNGGAQDASLFSAAGDIVTKFIPTAIASAVNEIYNIGPTVGNYFGGNFQQSDLRARLVELDNDFARYYDDHKLGVDTAGFIIGSLAPGMGGVKVLNAGQRVARKALAGEEMGAFTSRSMGLLAPERDIYLSDAIRSIRSSGDIFRFKETNTLKTLLSGFSQNALEAAAFETVVAATMNRSPILDELSMKDLFWNGVTGAALGGVIGGVFSGASASWKIAKAGREAQIEVAPWTITESVRATDTPSMKIASYWKQLDEMPLPYVEGDLVERSTRMYATKKATLENKILAEFNNLAGGDSTLGKAVTNATKGNPLEANYAMFLESKIISRATEVGPEERALNALNKKIAESGPTPPALNDAELELLANPPKIGYLKLVGDGAATGEVLEAKPAILSVFDKHAGDISVSKNRVKIGKKSFEQADEFDVLTSNHLEAEARQVWAERLPRWDEKALQTLVINAHDIPLLDKAIRERAFGVHVKAPNGAVTTYHTTEELIALKESLIPELATRLKGSIPKDEKILMDKLESIAMNSNIPMEALKKSIGTRLEKHSVDEIAKMLNVTRDSLEGIFTETAGKVDKRWLNGRDVHRTEYVERMKAKGVPERDIAADPLALPSVAKVVTKPSRELDSAGKRLEGIALYAQLNRVNAEAADRVSAQILGEALPRIPDEVIQTGNAGPTAMGFAAGMLGTIQSVMEYVGQRTNALRTKAIATAHSLFSPEVSALMNDLDGAIEFSVVNEKLRNLPHRYAFNPTKRAFMFKGTTEEMNEAVSKNWPLEIPLKNATVGKLIEKHISQNAVYQNSKGLIRSNEGLPHKFDPEIYYPIPRSPKNTPFFAFVVDESITGTGHTKMIYAANETELQTMINKIKQTSPQFNVLTKAESENYFKARGQYEYERSINDNYINTELARKGTAASFLPQTDPKVIFEDFIGWHTSRASNMIREAVSHKYARQFNALMQAGEDSLQAASSKMGYVSPLSYAENAVNNPASNLIKLALDVKKVEEYPIWNTMNKMLDATASELSVRISRLWEGATSTEHLAKINVALQKAGYGGAFPAGIDGALYEAMNGKIPRNKLTEFIGQANGLLSTFALRLDPFNALNNAIGSQVLLGTETRALLRAIREGSDEGAAELTKLMKIGVPGVEDMVTSPTKLIANSISRFSDPTLRAYYKQHGFTSTISDQYHQAMDELAASLARDGNISAIFTKLKGWADKGEGLTGNKVAEEFNRFIAADVMKQLTDVAVKHGLMDEGIALTYMNTFVNRTQGNFIASQRPILFQGPVGQAIGLFQTYQFNLIQQMLRHVGEGQAKSVATMLALQGSIYGMNGLPAFNAINTHIVGTAAGNTEHVDLVNVGYSAAGKVAGDWLVYGAGSNALGLFHPDLKNNLYSRGDVNPRSLTVVPSSLEDIPIVKASARLYSNLKDSFTRIGQGAPVWETMLRGIEHNGVSRPLAGMAQALEAVGSGKVTATNTHLNQVMSHDLMSLATLTRMAGAKPLDESLVNDMMFRFQAYDRHDKLKRSALGESIKLRILGGGEIEPTEIEKFTESYVKAGGKQEHFNKFMTAQVRNATVSQANQLKAALENPKVQQYQRLMGGYALEDLQNGKLQ